MTIDYRQAVKRNRFDLLYQDGRLAALIETAPDGETLLIENVAVLPEFQGRGFGKRLLKHSEELAVSIGLQRTRLYTNKLMTANLRLYAAQGYQVDREERFSHGVAVHMSKGCAPSLADSPG